MRKAQVGFDNGFKDMVEKELNTFSTTPRNSLSIQNPEFL